MILQFQALIADTIRVKLIPNFHEMFISAHTPVFKRQFVGCLWLSGRFWEDLGGKKRIQ
jgi:hypothetical protein